MKYFKFLLMVIIPIVLVSCGTPTSQLDDYYKVNRSTKKQSFSSEFADYIDDSTVVKVNNKSFDCYFAPMTTFVEKSTSSSSSNSLFSYSKKSSVYEGANNNYIFVFYNDTYYYSGFLYEFIISKNSELKDIGFAIRKFAEEQE